MTGISFSSSCCCASGCCDCSSCASVWLVSPNMQEKNMANMFDMDFMFLFRLLMVFAIFF